MSVLDGCLRCGRSLSLVEEVLEGRPVAVPGWGELCPECYRSLTPEEYRHYFLR
ncbi:MAG: hypothetical protein H5U00_06055 [Clostridia bacterium]|nr:hypothetical protein [Clostridia bacterium]